MAPARPPAPSVPGTVAVSVAVSVAGPFVGHHDRGRSAHRPMPLRRGAAVAISPPRAKDDARVRRCLLVCAPRREPSPSAHIPLGDRTDTHDMPQAEKTSPSGRLQAESRPDSIACRALTYDMARLGEGYREVTA